jgi:DNA-directed RNA polymerase specialized sigma24 family protein
VQESLPKAYVAWPRIRDVTSAEAYTRRVIVTTSISWCRRRSFLEQPAEVLPMAPSWTATTSSSHRRTCGAS